MKITGNHVAQVAGKLGYMIKEGKKRIIIYDERQLVTTAPTLTSSPRGTDQGRLPSHRRTPLAPSPRPPHSPHIMSLLF